VFGFFKTETIDGIVADIANKVTKLKAIRDERTARVAELRTEIDEAAYESHRAARLAEKFEDLIS
jgi:hypothetical protein